MNASRVMPTPGRWVFALWVLAVLTAPGEQVYSQDQAIQGLPSRTDWLEIVSDPGKDLPPTGITARKSPIYRGDLVTFDVLFSNSTEQDQRLDIDVTLGIAAFFVEADHGAELVEPGSAPETRQVSWPELDLPAHSSGRLELTVVLRPEEDGGDLVIDVEAFDLFGSGEPQRLNFHQALTYDPAIQYGPIPLWANLVLFGAPASLLLFALAVFFFDKQHLARRIAGSAAAAFGALFLSAIIGYGLIQGVTDSYYGATETLCVVLDRRANPETASSSSPRSAARTFHMPLIAAEYESRKGRQISVGFSSDVVSPGMDALGRYHIGDEVTCWYDNEWPDRFFVVRGWDFGTVFIFGLAMLGSLALFWVAYRPWKS